jgi:oxygen-independent coproporphyrinogen-3 oxidase
LYETAVERLARSGIAQYEISNFARPGRESLHNLKYWTLDEYAGFGADAHSLIGTERRRNVEAPEEYVERMARGESPCCEVLPARPGEERFFLGLRLRAGMRPTAEEWRRFEPQIAWLASEGLIETAGAVLRLTPRGILLSNEVFQEFLP